MTRKKEKLSVLPEGPFENMTSNPGEASEDEEQQQIRLLLDEHIRAVTALVQRLNRDIQGVQQQMRAQDEVTHRTQTSVRRMELQQLAILSDLRIRVGRCDDSIARLATDFRCTNEKIYKLIRQHRGSHTVMESRLRDMETQMRLVCISTVAQGVPSGQVSGPSGSTVDTRLKALSEQLTAQVASVQTELRKEQEGALRDTVDKIQRLCQSIKDQTSSSERALLERCGQLSDRLERLEEAQARRAPPPPHSSLQEMIDSRISKLHRQLRDEMEEMRAETNKGFTVVHDSLGSLRQVLEARMRMEREQLLRHIRGRGDEGDRKGDRLG